MPEYLFYVIAYVLPATVSSVMGVFVVRRTRVATPAVRRISRILWLLISLFAVVFGFAAGRLYTYVCIHRPELVSPSLPLRPAGIVLAIVSAQALIGLILCWYGSSRSRRLTLGPR